MKRIPYRRHAAAFQAAAKLADSMRSSGKMFDGPFEATSKPVKDCFAVSIGGATIRVGLHDDGTVSFPKSFYDRAPLALMSKVLAMVPRMRQMLRGPKNCRATMLNVSCGPMT